MDMVSINKVEERIKNKEGEFAKLSDVDDVLLALLAVKNGTKLTPELQQKVENNFDFSVPVIEGLVDEEDVEGKTYEIELLELTAFLIAKRRDSEKAKEVEKAYENYRQLFTDLYEDYDEEASEILNETIDKAEKIKKAKDLDI